LLKNIQQLSIKRLKQQVLRFNNVMFWKLLRLNMSGFVYRTCRSTKVQTASKKLEEMTTWPKFYIRVEQKVPLKESCFHIKALLASMLAAFSMGICARGIILFM